jgi:hypothetical protein
MNSDPPSLNIAVRTGCGSSRAAARAWNCGRSRLAACARRRLCFGVGLNAGVLGPDYGFRLLVVYVCMIVQDVSIQDPSVE